MKALISPNEVVSTGYRVAEVCELSFEVALPLFWVDCPNGVTASEYFYNPNTEGFEIRPEEQVPPPAFIPAQIGQQPQPVVEGAQTL